MGEHRAQAATTGRRRAGRWLVVTVVVGIGLAAGASVALAAGDDRPSAVKGTPCTAAARACVDLEANRAWLIKDGKILRGPVAVSHGGQGMETPKGDFAVEWKNKDHRSKEFDNAPMPYAVFFAPGGIAFHEGNLVTTSAGCVRLANADASAFYDYLQVGNAVQVR